MKTKKPNRIAKNGAQDRVTPQRLLVPVDFSDASLGALDHAARLAREWGASLRIVHVVPVDEGWLQIGREEFRELDQSLQEQAVSQLRAIAANLPYRIKAEIEAKIGRPAEEIAATAAETKTDLIILSTHGRTGFDRYFVGSVAERLVRLAACPVYLMPVRKESLQPDRSRPFVLRATRKH